MREFPDVIEGDILQTRRGKLKKIVSVTPWTIEFDDGDWLGPTSFPMLPGSYTIVKHAAAPFKRGQVVKHKKFGTLHLVRSCGKNLVQLNDYDDRFYGHVSNYEVVYDDLKM